MSPKRLFMALILVVLLPLVGCKAKEESQSTAGPATGDWLLMHMLSDPEQLNPLTSNDSGSSSILRYIFQGLLTRDPRSLELKPLLAESRPTISNDKLSYTFKIRRDATFQDGHPLTGEDVLFSIKAIKCPLVNAPFLRVYYNSLVDARLVDDFTIQFVTQEPYFLNESVLGGIDILPRHYYDPEDLLKKVTVQELNQGGAELSEEIKRFANQFNKNFNRNPMGSGPYKFLKWETGQEVLLERDDNYWGKGKPGIDQPYIYVYRFRVINNTDAALVSLKSGGLDTMSLQPLQHLKQTSSSRFQSEFQKFTYFSPGFTYIGWNNAHPIFRDKRVRRAMTYLTNRNQMVKTILSGLGQVVDSPIYYFRPEYDKTLESTPYDPEKALGLLKEAGWRDTDGDGVLDKVIDGKKVPFRFEIKFNSGNPTRKSVALILQDELKKHGIAATVRQLDWTIYLDDVRNHRFDAMILGWGMISYKNSRVDQILGTYRREFDFNKRVDLYREFQSILYEDQPYTFLFMPKSVSAVQRRFQGVEVLPIGGLRPLEWWVPLESQRYTSRPTA
jgi:peptide/nickel transport system substrate-binding protein